MDLSECDNEPIHLVGKIQPIGYLFLIKPRELNILGVSKNIIDIGISPESFIGTNLKKYLSLDFYFQLSSEFLKKQNDYKLNLIQFNFINRPFHSIINKNENIIILECFDEEENLGAENAFLNFQKKILNIENLNSILKETTDFFQSNLKFERVMIYKFDSEWNGEVIEESTSDRLNQFLNHKFPASDIPSQARKMLTEKRIRQIFDVDLPPSDIISNLNSDLTMSDLRYPSEIHLEYLRNMKVGSSLTISLIIKNKLWGLIACHNSKPVQIPVNIKSLCDKAGIFISKKIEKIILKEKIDQIDKARKIVKNLLTNQITPESITELKSLCECSGVGIYTSTLNVSEGIVPELAEFQLFMEWIFFYPKFIIFQTDEISKFIPEAKNWQNKICGILALKIQDGFIIWYRQEYIREIKWAGNPEKPTYLDQEKARISPRKSFEIWKEISQFKSNEWTEIEIEKVKLLSKI